MTTRDFFSPRQEKKLNRRASQGAPFRDPMSITRDNCPGTSSSTVKMPGKRQRLMHPVRQPESTSKTTNEDTTKTPTPAGRAANWTAEEDELLRSAVAAHKARNWKLIAESLPNRTDVQCLHRWQKVLNPLLVKGYWTKEEDDRVIELVEMFGTKRWAAIARCLPGRNGKQCRERWCNHLDPKIRHETWTEAEDALLISAHAKYGNKWAEISKLLPGRSDNGVKNRWNTAVRKRARSIAQEDDSTQRVNSHHDPRQRNPSNADSGGLGIAIEPCDQHENCIYCCVNGEGFPANHGWYSTF